MELGIEGKVVLVTGASRGIGAGIAKALGQHGATVIVNYLGNRDKAEEVLSRVKANGGDGMICQADVRDGGAVDEMVERGVKAYGKIDGLVNNANINFPIKPFVALSWEEVNAKITGEIQALYNCSQAVLRDMLPRKSGKLVMVSSSLSRHPAYGFGAHAAAKSAVDSMAKVMATELGPEGITVNVIGPGLVKTDATAGQPSEMFEQAAAFTPLRRVGLPDDVAGIAVFLVSSLSDYLTGQYIPATGGSFML
jgi:3-oxoacyl-[acyl-carrier protein] reductase